MASIARRILERTWANPWPKINFAGCALYYPAWRPDLGAAPTAAINLDGNDLLSVAVAQFRPADSSGAAEGWYRSSSTANNQTLLASCDTAGTTTFIHIYIASTTGRITISTQENGGTVNTISGTTNVCDGKWFHWKVNSSGTAWDIDVNGVAETMQAASSGSNTGDWFADIGLVAPRDNLTIGAKTTTSSGSYMIGVGGAVRMYSRTMATAEALTNYQRGRMAAASDATGLVFNLPMTEGTGNPVDTVGSLTMTATGATWITDTQFYSKDSSPKLLTNQGATWGSQGRLLNGTSDLLELSSADLNFTSGAYSILTNVYITALGASYIYIYCRGLWDTDGYGLSISNTGAMRGFTCQAAATQTTDTNTGLIVNGNWYSLGLTRSGTGITLYINGLNANKTSGTHTNPLTSARTVKLGAYDDKAVFSSIRLRDLLVFNRALSAYDVMLFYQNTKGRY